MRFSQEVSINMKDFGEIKDRFDNIQCYRKNVLIENYDDKVSIRVTCNGYGNGYGASSPCKETCTLRIDDLSEIKRVRNLSHKENYPDMWFWGQMYYLKLHPHYEFELFEEE